MKIHFVVLLQVVLIACLLYAIFDLPQLSSDSNSFSKEFESKALAFRVQSQSQTPSQEGSTTPESPNESTKEPTNENNPSKSQESSPEESNIPPKEPTNRDPQTSQPQKPSKEESSTLPKEINKEATTSEQEGNQSAESSDIDWKEMEVEESTLTLYPRGADLKTRCQRKDPKQDLLCKLTGKECIRHNPTQELAHLWVICPIFSPNQTKTRLLYEFHQNFISYIRLFGINTQAIEVVFPGQNYLVTKPGNEPHELQYKAEWAFNMRENLVNVGSKHLPSDWEYIAWIDAHVFWDENRYWFEDLIVELGRNNVVQVLESNTFINEANQTRYLLEGAAKAWERVHSINLLPQARQCGIAWATKREVFEAMDGVLDICIGASCDLYSNYAFFGRVWTTKCYNPDYAAAVRAWQEKTIKVVQKKIGYVKGNVIHWEHCIASDGCKTSSYDLMTNALRSTNYNPNTDFKRDFEGRLEFQSNFELAKNLWDIYGGDPRLL